MSSPDLGPTRALQQAANLVARVLAVGGSLAGLEERYPHQFAGLNAAERREARQLGRLAEGFRLQVAELPEGESVGSIQAIYAPFRLGNVDALPGETISQYLERTGRSLGGRWEVIFRERAGQEADPRNPQYRETLVSAAEYHTPGSIAATAYGELERRYSYDPESAYDLDESPDSVRYLPFDLH